MGSSRNFRELPITSGNLLGNFPKWWQVRNLPKSLQIWAWHYFSTSLGQWEVPGTSGNFPKFWQVGNFPKFLRILTWHYLLTFLCQWKVPGISWNFQELPKMLASLKLPKIPLESDMALFFNFPGSMGSSRYFWELPGTSLGTSWNADKLGTSQNPFWDFDIALFSTCLDQWEVPETSGNFPKSWQVRNYPKFLQILTWHYLQFPWVNGKFPKLPETSLRTS